MMPRILLLVLLLLCAAASAAPAQFEPSVRAPRALLRVLLDDLEKADNELSYLGLDSLAAWITVTRRDFNDDGVPEWVVQGTRFCGQNCGHWIYRRLPGGRFRQIHAGSGSGIVTLPRRRGGWHSLVEPSRMSSREYTRDYSGFNGRRYEWLATQYILSEDEREKTLWQLSITPPGPRVRRLALDPVHVGGGVWLSARYDACRPGREPTDVCGAPQLVLRSARLPAGRVCVRLRVVDMDRNEHVARPEGGWCGQTVPAAGAAGQRVLVLRPRREDWARLRYFSRAELAGPGMPGELHRDADGGLMAFATQLEHHYRLPCLPRLWCVELDGR